MAACAVSKPEDFGRTASLDFGGALRGSALPTDMTARKRLPVDRKKAWITTSEEILGDFGALD